MVFRSTGGQKLLPDLELLADGEGVGGEVVPRLEVVDGAAVLSGYAKERVALLDLVGDELGRLAFGLALGLCLSLRLQLLKKRLLRPQQ